MTICACVHLPCSARDAMKETYDVGLKKIERQAWDLGTQVRKYMCEEKGLVSVAAPGFEAPVTCLCEPQP